jgi:hypothetical protein
MSCEVTPLLCLATRGGGKWVCILPRYVEGTRCRYHYLVSVRSERALALIPAELLKAPVVPSTHDEPGGGRPPDVP